MSIACCCARSILMMPVAHSSRSKRPYESVIGRTTPQAGINSTACCCTALLASCENRAILLLLLLLLLRLCSCLLQVRGACLYTASSSQLISFTCLRIALSERSPVFDVQCCLSYLVYEFDTGAGAGTACTTSNYLKWNAFACGWATTDY